jgi:hypothetical protein
MPTLILLALVTSGQFVVGQSTQAECIRDGSGQVACGFGCQRGPDGRAVCASEPGGACLAGTDGRLVCSAPTGAVARLPFRRAECLRGSDGHAACGYACVRGSDGIARCAQTSDGACLVGGSGRAVCSELPSSSRIVVIAEPVQAECVRASNGSVACGYACERAANGTVACATTPDGACTREPSGGVVCTTFDPQSRVYLGAVPEAECVRGSDGVAVCGYACAKGSNGRAVCAPSPFGACAKGADGIVRCGP